MSKGRDKNRKKYTVVGAGCGGQSIAGYLASDGNDVRLYNRSMDRIEPLIDNPNIKLKGSLNARGKLSYVGKDMKEAVSGSDLIMVVTTATGHKYVAEEMSPHLRDGQIIILNPGRTCGALEVDNTLKKSGCDADVIVSEANTLIYAVRVPTPGIADVKGVKREVSLSALKRRDTPYVIDAINGSYPQFVPAESMLETSFGNIGAIFHPAIAICNKDRISKKEDFNFYTEGVTVDVAKIMEEIDYESMSVAEALDAKPLSATKWLSSRYGVPLSDIYDMIISNPTYQGIKAPDTLNHRYLWEDIPTGMVPVSSFGEALGVDTPTINRFIDEGSDILGRDFRSEGRTPESLGLDSKNLKRDLHDIIGI